MLRQITSAVIGFVATCAAASGTTRVCVDSTTAGFPISPAYAAVANNPLYQGSGNSGTNPLHCDSVKGGITGTLPGGWDYAGAPVSTDDATLIACPVANSGSGAVGFVTFSNGNTGPIRVTNAAGKGFIGSSRKSGSIIYLDREGKEMMRTLSPDGKIVGSIPDTWGSFAHYTSCAISSDSNEVAFVGQPSGGATQSLYVGSPTASTATLTLTGNNFGACAVSKTCVAWTDSDSNGNRVLITSPRDHASGLPTGKRMHKPFVITKELDFSMSNDGSQVAMCDGSSIYLDSTTTDGVPVGNPPFAAAASIPLLTAGMPLDGSTISTLSLSPQSYTAGDTELMFFATLQNGTSGIFATTVPEPTTIAALAFALPLVRRRR